MAVLYYIRGKESLFLIVRLGIYMFSRGAGSMKYAIDMIVYEDEI